VQTPGLKMTGQLPANWIREIQSRTGWAISMLALAFGGGALALGFAAEWAGLRFNDSPSMPTGLYVRTTSESNATLVVFCPAEPFAKLSVERGYRSRGNCPDGAEPLAKPTAAHAGDLVELSATGLAVNGRLLQNTPPLATDTAGRPLSHWPFGRYVVAPGTVWVASSYSRRSFDSRYFGPVEASQVREHVRPLLTAH
jgi:conjugative transfer signal peptidase TraF